MAGYSEVPGSDLGFSNIKPRVPEVVVFGLLHVEHMSANHLSLDFGLGFRVSGTSLMVLDLCCLSLTGFVVTDEDSNISRLLRSKHVCKCSLVPRGGCLFQVMISCSGLEFIIYFLMFGN